MVEREGKGERIDDTKTAIPTFRPCMVHACLIWGYHVRTSYGGLPVLRFCTRLRIDQEKNRKARNSESAERCTSWEKQLSQFRGNHCSI